jgi:hypothetical protein
MSGNIQFVSVPSSIEILREEYFCDCGTLSRVTFDSDSQLSRVEAFAFWLFITFVHSHSLFASIRTPPLCGRTESVSVRKKCGYGTRQEGR